MKIQKFDGALVQSTLVCNYHKDSVHNGCGEKAFSCFCLASDLYYLSAFKLLKEGLLL